MVGYVCVPGANIAQRCVFSGPEVNNSLQMFLPSAANQKSRSTADGGFKLGEQKTPSENNRMLTRIRFLASQHLNNEPEVFIYRQDSPPNDSNIFISIFPGMSFKLLAKSGASLIFLVSGGRHPSSYSFGSPGTKSRDLARSGR
jgi:hypothetical protein